MIDRRRELETLERLRSRHPVVGIVGARQVGKTTLARAAAKRSGRPVAYFDLEDPEDAARLTDPILALKNLKGLVVIDEIQRRQDLFPVIRVLVDRPRSGTRFLVLGSASPDLLRQGSETLAGRIVYHELKGFSIDEVGIGNYARLWLRGGFPRAYLARSHSASDEWRRGFIRTFLERDVPQLGISIRSTTLRRFWTMLAHWHGQIWNASEFGRAFGVADTTVRNYLDILTSALVVRQLQPWHENISKRQVRSPKIYVADSGLVHTLLGLRTAKDLEGHPKIGASWEGFAIENVVRRLGARSDQCFFWATHGGAELDLLVIHGRKRLGFEVKRTTAPRLTPSMGIALNDLKLRRLDVIHSGESTFPLAKGVRAVSFSRILKDLSWLEG
jgi:predicted AAA+ superfamily ATPase